MKIICLQELNGKSEFYQSVERMLELNPTMKCYLPKGAASEEVDATVEWINQELTDNGVASIHKASDTNVFCGIEFGGEITNYVASWIDVK